jgi:glycosyltransferase involved in cell wall biosynthesis
MKVVHVNTWDVTGGAATAMYRWHRALVDGGIDSSVLCCSKSSDDPTVFSDANLISKQRSSRSDIVQSAYFESNRTSVSNTYFSHPYGKYRIRDHRVIKGADVIHLHWFSHFIDLLDLVALREGGKTIVFTPHDLWGATGGCHFPGDCRRFLTTCYPCPLLESDPVSFVPRCQEFKTAVLSNVLDEIICPSKWISTEIALHPAFARVPISVVPYCLDKHNLSPEEKLTARNAIGIAPERFVVLFVGHYVNELRKGLASFLDLLRRLAANTNFFQQHRSSLKFLIIGNNSEGLPVQAAFDVESCGFIADRTILQRYFSAADILLYTGTQDNLPNVILESLACGTPVLAFRTGGVPDIVEHGVNGYMVPPGDLEELDRALRNLIENRAVLERMSVSCMRSATQKFGPQMIFPQLLNRYEAAVSLRRGSSRPLNLASTAREHAEIPNDIAWASHELVAKTLKDLQSQTQELGRALQEKGRLIVSMSENIERLSQNAQQQEGMIEKLEQQARIIQKQGKFISELQSFSGWLRNLFRRTKVLEKDK